MPLAKTQEERDIERRCKAWAFKLAHENVYVLFDHLPGRTLAQIWVGMVRLRKYGMRSFQRNPVIFDLAKIKADGHDIEETIIHECMHLKIRNKKDPHCGEFHAAMKAQLGRYEWERKPEPPSSYTGTGTITVDGKPFAEGTITGITLTKE